MECGLPVTASGSSFQAGALSPTDKTSLNSAPGAEPAAVNAATIAKTRTRIFGKELRQYKKIT
jgi:hypothetical protein